MENLKKIRKARGLTQEELGKIVGVSKSSISQYESGTKTPSFEVGLKLAEALDCESADLVSARDIITTIREKTIILNEGKKMPATESDGKDNSPTNEVDAFATSLFRQLPIERKIFLITQMQAELQNLLTRDVPEESD